LDHTLEKLRDRSLATLKQQQGALAAVENGIRMMDPKNVLKRGYSITRFKGKAVRSADQIKPGDLMTTYLFEGEIVSLVNTLKTDGHGTG
jgi:exodeoxyribonuclease VII large subunit